MPQMHSGKKIRQIARIIALIRDGNNGMLSHIGFTRVEANVAASGTLPPYDGAFSFKVKTLGVATNPVSPNHGIATKLLDF